MKTLKFRTLFLIFLFVSALFTDGCGCGNNRHYIKGRELYRDKDVAGAIEELKLAHKQQPKNTEIISFLGKVYFESKNYDGAVEMYEKELQLVPNDIQAHFNVAKAYKEKGDGTLAREHFNRVIEINPKGKLAGEAQKLMADCQDTKPAATVTSGTEQEAGGGKGQSVKQGGARGVRRAGGM